MILDKLKDRFVIVARQGNSAEYEPNSARALASAFPDADIIMADVTSTRDGAIVCTKDARIDMWSAAEVENDSDVVPLRDLMGWVKETDKGLLLNPRTASAKIITGVVAEAEHMGLLDRVSVVSHSLKHTKYIHLQNDKVGIVGFLRDPQQYAEFYKQGGHVATLRHLTTSPLNVRLAEAAQGPHRHPFLVLAGVAETHDVFNACNGLVGAKGIIMRNPQVGREAMDRRAASTPACASCAPD